MRRAVAVAALALAIGLPTPAHAAEIEGEAFSERIAAGPQPLELCSASLLRWKRLLKVYVAALYLDECEVLPARPSDAPQRLELAYLRGFDGPQFAKAAETVLERSFDADVLAPLRERIADLHAAYRDVDAGDRYTLTYLPGTGTELALNGKPLIIVPGADFAAAYFAIWLGPEPADVGLRDRLLKRP